MSERLPAGCRMALPAPFMHCACKTCKEYRSKANDENRKAPFRLKTKKMTVRIDFRFEVHEWVTQQRIRNRMA